MPAALLFCEVTMIVALDQEYRGCINPHPWPARADACRHSPTGLGGGGLMESSLR